MMRRAVACVVLCLVPAACAAAGAPGAAARVSKITDGDTIRVVLDGRELKVRLIGIDTPELHKPGAPVGCFAREATARIASLIDGEEVRLDYDVDRIDRYGRTLAYVYRARDGLFINHALVRDGYATVFTVPPNVAHAQEFLRAQREARAAGRGLWSRCA